MLVYKRFGIPRITSFGHLFALPMGAAQGFWANPQGRTWQVLPSGVSLGSHSQAPYSSPLFDKIVGIKNVLEVLRRTLHSGMTHDLKMQHWGLLPERYICLVESSSPSLNLTSCVASDALPTLSVPQCFPM